MSLVSTYVPADNGKLYRNPILSGKDWFICFDDEDPAELVVKEKSNLNPIDIFDSIGMTVADFREYTRCGRIFGKKIIVEDSICYFFEPTNPINHKFITEHDGIIKENKIGQGVVYHFKGKR